MAPDPAVRETPSVERLQAENADLRRRLREAERTIDAIRGASLAADRPLRVYVESVRQGALTLSTDGTVAYCNPRLADLLGTMPERVAGRDLRDLVPEPERPACDALLGEAPAGDGIAPAAEVETRLIRGDGTSVPVLLSVGPLPPDAGAALYCLVTDLTEHKHYEELRRTQAALQASEERFRAIAERSVAGIAEVDTSGRFLLVNDRHCEILGRSREELLGGLRM
ncbi:MAG TPA: PAS domain S-box protein, partial [Planctomycetaceae bacterium]